MQGIVLARRRLGAVMLMLFVFSLISMAQAQPPAQAPGSQSSQSQAMAQDQQPMASAMISADRKTQGPATPPKPIVNEVIIRGGTILTVTHGVIQNGSIHIKNGKIVAVGTNLAVPAGATVIDATNKFITPGLIDAHSHMALDNELTNPSVPHMMMIDAFDYQDKALYHALAGGVTSELLLHGSGDVIGGQAVVVKNKVGLSRDEMLFPNAPRSIKMASGENPKRVFGQRGQLPSTRMGNFEVLRAQLQEGREYMRDWDDYNAKVKNGDKNARAPKRDLRLEALADILRGNLLVQIHCYRSDEMLTEMAIAKEFGYKVRAFHHALEAYKVAPQLSAEGVAIATWPDWWGFKNEGWDGIPWNAAINLKNGVRVALKSDSNDVVRRLNSEAAKVVRYGVPEEEALKMITINPAWIIGVDDRVGSIDVGKDADIVIWNGPPLTSVALADKVLIDGDVFFDRSLPGFGLTHYKGTPGRPNAPMHGDDAAEVRQ
jgi:imidazolonepropionase-like amidohydrolase